jgi:hypothetical protein
MFPPVAAPLPRSTTIHGKGKAGERAENPSWTVPSERQGEVCSFFVKNEDPLGRLHEPFLEDV